MNFASIHSVIKCPHSCILLRCVHGHVAAYHHECVTSLMTHSVTCRSGLEISRTGSTMHLIAMGHCLRAEVALTTDTAAAAAAAVCALIVPVPITLHDLTHNFSENRGSSLVRIDAATYTEPCEG